MKTVQIIEQIECDETYWIISLTNSNPEYKDSFVVSSESEALRVKLMLENWANK